MSGSGVSKYGWMSSRLVTRGRVSEGWLAPRCCSVKGIVARKQVKSKEIFLKDKSVRHQTYLLKKPNEKITLKCLNIPNFRKLLLFEFCCFTSNELSEKQLMP
jgi:hypothetical protein